MGNLKEESQAHKEAEKPEGEKTYFGVRLVCAKRLLDETIKTELMTVAEIKYIMTQIKQGTPVDIPTERNIKVQTAERFPDTFVITRSLLEDLDFVECGVHEGWKRVVE